MLNIGDGLSDSKKNIYLSFLSEVVSDRLCQILSKTWISLGTALSDQSSREIPVSNVNGCTTSI